MLNRWDIICFSEFLKGRYVSAWELVKGTDVADIEVLQMVNHIPLNSK